MIQIGDMAFREVWLGDFEFSAPPGERPTVVCMIARELGSQRTLRLWQDELVTLNRPPYSVGPESLFVAYYASAEIGCHLALDWSLPINVLDLFTEFRNLTNGLSTPCGNSLLGALAWFGLSAIEATEKESMRELAQRGGPWTANERKMLLDYCESDVEALTRLITAMVPKLDLRRALLRGRYMRAAAQIEQNGIPIDTNTLQLLREHWGGIQDRLITEIDRDYGVYDGHSFKADRFANWLVRHDIPWPRLESGALDLSDDTFREMSRMHTDVAALRELRVALSKMRLSELVVGSDGRNRCLLSAFRSRTGRNQPSNSRFIFGPAVWLRGLIKPPPGYGLAYIDWSQQEFGIAAALSGDPQMQQAYLSGDPYLEFAKQAGAVPPNVTKRSHKAAREQFKACMLAVQYGMGPKSLAERIGQPVTHAKNLLRLHEETYRVFWKWSDAAVDHAMLCGRLWTVFGWTVHTSTNPNPRFLRNFLMQANGAEKLRLACCLVVEAGIKVCAPIHDAILIEAPLEELDKTVQTAQVLMARASEIVLGGFQLRSEAEVVRYPNCYMDDRGRTMWKKVMGILGNQQPDSRWAPAATPLLHGCNGTCTPTPTRPILFLSNDEVLK